MFWQFPHIIVCHAKALQGIRRTSGIAKNNKNRGFMIIIKIIKNKGSMKSRGSSDGQFHSANKERK